MYQLNKNEYAIITTVPTENDYDNNLCHLRRVISSLDSDEINGIERFKVRTDLVYYQTEIIDPSAFSHSEAETNTETKKIKVKNLILSETKQQWSLQEYSMSKLDKFAKQLEKQIPANLSRSERNKQELLIQFLLITQKDTPWGVDATKWKVMTNEDYHSEEEINVPAK